MGQLSGNLVVVTRGATTFGEEVVKRAALYGANVLFTFNPMLDPSFEARRISEEAGESVKAIALDPKDVSMRLRFYGAIKKGGNRKADYWISTAGFLSTDSLEDEVSILNGALDPMRGGLISPRGQKIFVCPKGYYHGRFSDGVNSSYDAKELGIRVIEPSSFQSRDERKSKIGRLRESAKNLVGIAITYALDDSVKYI